MTTTLTAQDKQTLRTAAYGALSLISAADAAGGSPHKAATAGSIALGSATGLVGHILAEKSTGVRLESKSVAALADQVLPALTAAMTLLTNHSPSEAANFRTTVLVAIEAATHKTGSTPTVADMTRKITAALDAA